MKELRVGQVFVEVEYSDRITTTETVQKPEFPELLSRWAEGGPRFRTEIWVNRAGEETRAILASRPLWEWTVPIGEQEPVTADEVTDLFRACWGQTHAFKFRNPIDYELEREVIGWGDDITTVFTVQKRWRAGGRTIDIPIKSLECGSVTVYICNQWRGSSPAATEGTDYVVDYDNGVVTLTDPLPAGASLLISGRYYMQARFSREDVMATVETADVYAIGSVEVQEVAHG